MRLPAMVVATLVLACAQAAWAGECATPLGGSAALPVSALRTALADDNRLEIVALGSSSTQGVGASVPARAYPAQLAAILAARLSGRGIEVANKGVGGETVADNLTRIERDVAASDPDIVIWQVGTNDALRGRPLETVRAELIGGIRRMQAGGALVVLMDPQPLAAPEKERLIAAMSDVIEEAARSTGSAFFSRHALMGQWLRAGTFTPASLLGGDGLHMTDAGYRCLAESMAGFLLPASGSMVTAALHPF